MELIFLVCTCKVYNHANIYIDRPDLTRKMSCLETWVPKVIEKGYEVIFYSGGESKNYYDEQNHHLYLDADDDYDYGEKISPQFDKIKATAKWLLDNKNFDYIYLITDSDYVNINHFTKDTENRLLEYDFLSNGSGGEGFFLSKKACDILVNDPYTNVIKHSDSAIDTFFKIGINHKYDLRIGSVGSIGLNTIKSYILSENYFLIHYCTGKRMYWVDFVLSQYNNKTPIKRKIAINLPIDATVGQLVNSYPTISGGNTPLYYSFTTDKNGWEHYGAFVRSDSISSFMFGEASIYKGVFIDYHLLAEYGSDINDIVVNRVLPSIQKDGFIIFYYKENLYGYYELLKEILTKHNINFKIENNLLEKVDIEQDLIIKSEVNFNKEYIIIYG